MIVNMSHIAPKQLYALTGSSAHRLAHTQAYTSIAMLLIQANHDRKYT